MYINVYKRGPNAHWERVCGHKVTEFTTQEDRVYNLRGQSLQPCFEVKKSAYFFKKVSLFVFFYYYFLFYYSYSDLFCCIDKN